MIGVIDYKAGNLGSVTSALDHFGLKFELLQEPPRQKKFKVLLLPGVGHFGHAMANLDREGFRDFILESNANGVSVLGICLGMQLLFEGSEEAPGVAGLGFFAGEVLNNAEKGRQATRIGWSDVHFQGESSSLNGEYFFAHTFQAKPINNEEVLGTYEWGNTPVVAAVARENIIGVQFHPEKSGLRGLQFLEQSIAKLSL